MGEPSREQIDEAIAWGLANRWSEQRILKHLATLERMSGEELAAVGVFPRAAKDSDPSPSLSPSGAAAVSPSRGHPSEGTPPAHGLRDPCPG